MSIETLFLSKEGELRVLNRGALPGQTSYVHFYIGGIERVVASRCDETDDGAAAMGINNDNFAKVNEEFGGIPQPVLQELEDMKIKTGILFQAEVTLPNGKEGTISIRHQNSNQAQYN